MVRRTNMSKSNDDWMAEEDASILSRYQDIVGNPSRMNRAIKAAEKRAKAYQEQANSLKRVGNMRSSKKK